MLQEVECIFDDPADRFTAFGTGQIYPHDGSNQSFIGVATITNGTGRFTGHPGTIVICGEITEDGSFRGSFMSRVMDPPQTLHQQAGLAPLVQQRVEREAGYTYLIFRGEAVPSDPIRPNIGPDGSQIGVVVEQGLKLQTIDADSHPGHGTRTTSRVGSRLGKVTAHVVFDPESAAGTDEEPIPFTAYDIFEFNDPSGHPIGSFVADTTNGRVFNMLVGSSGGIRFGGVGQIRSGDGIFAGIEGWMTDNSVVVFEPHVSASIYVLRVKDPNGRIDAALRRS